MTLLKGLAPISSGSHDASSVSDAIGGDSSYREAPVFSGPEALVQSIRTLHPEIKSRSGEIESSGRVPADIQEMLAATGVFRMIRPSALGGADFRLPDVIPVLEAIAEADGSLAWSAMIGTESPAIWMRFGPEMLESIFGSGEEVMTRAALTPRGRVTKVPNGYVFDGTWPFVSGSYAPDWFLVGGLVTDPSGVAVLDGRGRQEVRIGVLPATDVVIQDTWRAFGLRSTESHDIRITEKFLAESSTAPYFAIAEDGPSLGQLPLYPVLSAFHVGVVLGLARAMLNELAQAVKQKRPFMNPKIRLPEDPLFQHRIAHMELRLSAARSFVVGETETLWSHVGLKMGTPLIARARYRSVVAYVHQECMAIANEIFALSGTGILDLGSSLQRRFRDIRSVCQHVLAGDDIYRPFGALILGEDNDMIAGL